MPMRPPSKPGFRLPAHLGGSSKAGKVGGPARGGTGGGAGGGPEAANRLRRIGLLRGDADEDRAATVRPANVRPATVKKGPRPTAPTSAPAAPDRLGSLVLPVLETLFGPCGRTLPGGPLLCTCEELLAAMAPYYRPGSRFENLMVRRLVGDGMLSPRGGLEKQGLSGAYTLTRRGERLLELERG